MTTTQATETIRITAKDGRVIESHFPVALVGENYWTVAKGLSDRQFHIAKDALKDADFCWNASGKCWEGDLSQVEWNRQMRPVIEAVNAGLIIVEAM